MLSMKENAYQGPLQAAIAATSAMDTTALWWLGQAGFTIKYQGSLIMIDPYLSDFLAKKYQGAEFPHRRLMRPPIRPDEVAGLDLLLCTHQHSDHLDPETVPVLASNNPGCTVVVPKSSRARAVELDVPADQLHPLDAHEQMTLGDALRVDALPAAHEDLQTNEQGEHLFLGYILTLGGLTIYHSGDCVPYAELFDALQKYPIDLALLPVNGRDEYRSSRGIQGNFTLAEAVSLCQQLKIPGLLGHHFGMFAFNTIEVPLAEQQLRDLRTPNQQYWLVKAGVQYTLSAETA